MNYLKICLTSFQILFCSILFAQAVVTISTEDGEKFSVFAEDGEGANQNSDSKQTFNLVPGTYVLNIDFPNSPMDNFKATITSKEGFEVTYLIHRSSSDNKYFADYISKKPLTSSSQDNTEKQKYNPYRDIVLEDIESDDSEIEGNLAILNENNWSWDETNNALSDISTFLKTEGYVNLETVRSCFQEKIKSKFTPSQFELLSTDKKRNEFVYLAWTCNATKNEHGQKNSETTSNDYSTNKQDPIYLYGFNVGHWKYLNNSSELKCSICDKNCAVKKNSAEMDADKKKTLESIMEEVSRDQFTHSMEWYRGSARQENVTKEVYAFKVLKQKDKLHGCDEIDLYRAAYSHYEVFYNMFKAENFCSNEHFETGKEAMSNAAQNRLKSLMQGNSETKTVTSNNNNASECWSCGGSGKCNTCNKSCKKVQFKNCEAPTFREEIRPGYVLCNDCSGYGVQRTNVGCGCTGWCVESDCYVNSCEGGWVQCRDCYSSPGTCKHCHGTGKH